MHGSQGPGEAKLPWRPGQSWGAMPLARAEPHYLPRGYFALDRFFAGCRLGEAMKSTKGLVVSQRRQVRLVADYHSDT